MKKRRVLFIGLGWEQFDLARRLKEQGHAVLALSALPARRLRGLADEARDIDPLAYGKAIAAARAWKADAVVSDQCDYSRYAEETVARALRLPTRAAGTAVGISKQLQRALAPRGVRQPDWRVCHDEPSAAAAFRVLGGDVMVKPSDARGSLGVSRVRRPADLGEAYHNARRNGVTGPVLVERFLPGELVTLDGLVADGRFELKAVSRSTHTTGAAVRLQQHVYYRPEDQASLARAGEPAVRALCAAFGLTSGFVHSEWLWDGRALAFVELANRAPGIRAVSRMIEPLCGQDLYARVYPELLRPRPIASSRYFVQQFHFGPIARAGKPFLKGGLRRDARLVDHLEWPYEDDGTGRIVRLGHATFGGEALPELQTLARSCGARSAC